MVASTVRCAGGSPRWPPSTPRPPAGAQRRRLTADHGIEQLPGGCPDISGREGSMDTPDTHADGIPAGGAQARQEPPALLLTGLLKRFGDKTAVDHVDLTVPRGSFFGLVGPNGAGKTTSLSMAVGLLRPDGGGARDLRRRRLGRPGRRQGAARRPARRPGPARAADRTGAAHATWACCGAWTRPTVARTRPGAAGGPRARPMPSRPWSSTTPTGMRKKIGLATALLHAPRLLVLDEPFEAVDPVSARPSGRSSSGSSPPAARWSSPVTSWRWSSSSATTSP